MGSPAVGNSGPAVVNRPAVPIGGLAGVSGGGALPHVVGWPSTGGDSTVVSDPDAVADPAAIGDPAAVRGPNVGGGAAHTALPVLGAPTSVKIPYVVGNPGNPEDVDPGIIPFATRGSAIAVGYIPMGTTTATVSLAEGMGGIIFPDQSTLLPGEQRQYKGADVSFIYAMVVNGTATIPMTVARTGGPSVSATKKAELHNVALPDDEAPVRTGSSKSQNIISGGTQGSSAATGAKSTSTSKTSSASRGAGFQLDYSSPACIAAIFAVFHLF